MRTHHVFRRCCSAATVLIAILMVGMPGASALTEEDHSAPPPSCEPEATPCVQALAAGLPERIAAEAAVADLIERALRFDAGVAAAASAASRQDGGMDSSDLRVTRSAKGEEFVLGVAPGEEGASIVAARASDGSTAWTYASDADVIDFWVDADLDADEQQDVVTRGFRALEDHPGSQDAGSFARAYEWTIVALSGATGEPLWSYDLSGAMSGRGHAQFIPGVGFLGSGFDARAIGLRVAIVDDVTGDSIADIVVHSDTYSRSWMSASVSNSGVLVVGNSASPPVVASIARVLSGADGSVAFEMRSLPKASNGLATLSSGGDATGDGATDLLWYEPAGKNPADACVRIYRSWSPVLNTCSSATLEAAMLTLITSRTFERQWQQPLSSDGSVLPPMSLRADLTGDGADDFVLVEQKWPQGVLQLRSGDDGSLVWAQEQNVAWLQPWTAGGARDLLSVQYQNDGWTTRIRVDRLDGATGASLATTTISSSPPAGYFVDSVQAVRVGDVDDDGTDELLVSVTASRMVPPHFVTKMFATSWYMISGHALELVWAHSVADSPSPPMAHVSPDGAQLAFSFSESVGSFSHRHYVAAWDGRLVAPLWEAEVGGSPAWLSGTATHDIVLAYTSAEGAASAYLNGSTGLPAWVRAMEARALI